MDRERLTFVVQIGRTSLLGTTFIFVLLGVASAAGRHGAGPVALALAASVACHVAVYASNDVADLEVDRTQPRRATSPLVRGLVAPGTVVKIAAGAAVVALALAAPRGLGPLGWMACSLALLLVYNVVGKRIRLTPATDLVQGLGWAALVAYGAAAVGEPTSATAWVEAYVVLTIVLVNGIHGGLRDLPNDCAAGARTTAILLGARTLPGGGARLTAGLVAYALALQAGMIAILLAGLVTEHAAATELVLGALGGVASMALLAYGLAAAHTPARSWHAALAHILLILALPVLLVTGRLDPLLAALLVVLFGAPWASVGGALRRGCAPPARERRLA